MVRSPGPCGQAFITRFMIPINPDPAHYAFQLQAKEKRLSALLAPFRAPKPAVFSSPALHYRERAEFKVWHEDDHSYYAMFPHGKGAAPALLTDFPVASVTINRIMPGLLKAIERDPILRHKLFQAEFLSTTTGDLLATLVYHKALGDDWESAARRLQNELAIKLVGRSRRQKIVLERDYVEETFTVGEKPYRYRQLEGYFSQPNGAVCERMLNWVTDCVGDSEGDFLELYCGNGNFTLPLADRFRRGLATEVAKPLIHVARVNAAQNGVDNVCFARLAAEEVSQALRGVREFRRLREIDLDGYEFSTVFVDPPRAGLDSQTVELVRGFDRIVYVSCNPLTLVENLKQLKQSHRIEQAALFDQFPYTEHMECGVYLKSD